MSKHNSAPISDLASSAFTLSKRSLRNLSKSIRCSQSTAIVPVVFMSRPPMIVLWTAEFCETLAAHRFGRFEYQAIGRHGGVLERGRKGNGNVHRSDALHRLIQI